MPVITAGTIEPDDSGNGNPSKGSVVSYVHPGGRIGVLLEAGCESEFLASSEGFQSLLKDLAMHIAAFDPKYISRNDVPREVCSKQNDALAFEVGAEQIQRKMEEFYQELCLLDQPFVKEPGITVGQLIETRSDEWGDEISVRRFARFEVSKPGETIAIKNPPRGTKE